MYKGRFRRGLFCMYNVSNKTYIIRIFKDYSRILIRIHNIYELYIEKKKKIRNLIAGFFSQYNLPYVFGIKKFANIYSKLKHYVTEILNTYVRGAYYKIRPI